MNRSDSFRPPQAGIVRRFTQVDVFSDQLMYGNPVAVVHDADDLTTHDMADFARWTNLSETTFLSAPTDDSADYRLRIFTTPPISRTPGVRFLSTPLRPF